MHSTELKSIAEDFLHLCAKGLARKAFGLYTAEKIIHHNPFFRGDEKSLMLAMEKDAMENPGKILEIKQLIQEGSRVVIFSHIRQNSNDRGYAVVHIFRFDSDKIAELWDLAQEMPETSLNENGIF